ncbi:RidA family protein [Pseudemcibacter aquimaris]|uniref:RidA family protein n=1 Tax=Pseudemcibacter aquimaris TaxID=2857064 RepID=UPI0020134F5E|nr:RidA family protein [Pseudemcibacter aquimaris]MCC3861086.1 RidA family protein [Pseudemcibacter aquimaris]WDU59904.1 RidA family protein [Pseudemcibacter aquimaris]
MKRRNFFAAAGATALGASLLASKANAQSAGKVDAKLAELGVEVAAAAAPVAAYVGWRKVGKLVYIAGQVPSGPDGLVTGKLGDNMTTEQGYQAARYCGINILSQLKSACDGDLDKVKQCIQIQGLVNSTDDFTEQHLVVNGTSELFRDIWGEPGLAARAAVGTNSLPLGICCEVLAVFEVA